MKVLIVFCIFVFAIGSVLGEFETCIHGGVEYKEGDIFPPNRTYVKIEGPDQCIQCRCKLGMVLCDIESCPKLECDSPIQVQRSCCLQCPAVIPEKLETSELVFERSATGKENLNGNCVSNGKQFQNGSVWQPVFGPFGVMACVQCRCRNGSIVCARLECGDLPCSQPKRQLGQCCPVCPLTEDKKESYCLPESSEIFVFKTANVQDNSDKIEYAFLENKNNNEMVRIHTWDLTAINSVDLFSVSTISRNEFQGKNFIPIGSTSKRQLSRYSRREKKLRNNCFLKCISKIQRLEKSLIEYPVNTQEECFEDEVDVAVVAFQ